MHVDMLAVPPTSSVARVTPRWRRFAVLRHRRVFLDDVVAALTLRHTDTVDGALTLAAQTTPLRAHQGALPGPSHPHSVEVVAPPPLDRFRQRGVGLIAELCPLSPEGEPMEAEAFVVATTHLYWNPAATHVKEAQVGRHG